MAPAAHISHENQEGVLLHACIQGGSVWLGGEADLESNAFKPQQNAFVYGYS